MREDVATTANMECRSKAKILSTADIPVGRKLHIPELSSIRGIAAVIVVFGHVFSIIDQPYFSNTAFGHVAYNFVARTFNGPAAVEIFFVLSGLVLSLSERQAHHHVMRWVPSFFIKRIFRIYPALWVSVALALALLPLARNGCSTGLCTPWASNAFQDEFTKEKIILSFAGLFVHLNGPLWSLRVEIFYSFLFPLIFLSLRNRKTRILTFLIALVLALLPIPRIYSLHYALAFVLGSAIPLLHTEYKGFPFRTAALLSGIILIFSRQIFSAFNFDEKTFEVLEIFASFVIIYAIFHKKIDFAFLRNRVFYYVGETSYSIYVLHFPILFSLFYVLEKLFGVQLIQNSPALFTAILGFATLAITLGASALNFTFVEVPFQMLGRKISKRFEPE